MSEPRDIIRQTASYTRFLSVCYRLRFFLISQNCFSKGVNFASADLGMYSVLVSKSGSPSDVNVRGEEYQLQYAPPNSTTVCS